MPCGADTKCDTCAVLSLKAQAFRVHICLEHKHLEHKQTQHTTTQHNKYRVGLAVACQEERCGKERNADTETYRLVFRRAEVVFGHKQQRCGCYQAHNGWAQTGEHALHRLRVAVGYEVSRYEYHDDERQPDDGERRQHRSYHRHPLGIALVEHRRIAYVCSGVDADRTRRRLTDGNDVRKLRVCEPRILHNRLVVYERQHGVAATEVERANLREYNKQF